MPAVTGILIAGTSSDAGKSLVVTGLCRALSRRGVAVAPFKAQNMSNNSMVCADGSEIGRAQYLQAQAAGAEATSAMNPVLLKPGSDRRSFVVLRGRPYGTLEAGAYATGRRALAEAAFAAYSELSDKYDLIVCEGAGSPAEINLRAGDYVNLGLARRFDLPVTVVGDIDRGGVFASLYGTAALLDDADRRLLRAFVINKFRGDRTVLEPGLGDLTRRTGIPFAGVLPWLPDLWLDAEDTLEIGRWRRPSERSDALKVAVIRLPRVSNVTDVDALAAEPGVEVLVTTDPAVVAGADVAVLPGTRSTVDDLAWLRGRGLADAITDRARRQAPVLGICGGYQMLATRIHDRHRIRRRPGRRPGPAPDRSHVRDAQSARPSGRKLAWGRRERVRDPSRHRHDHVGRRRRRPRALPRRGPDRLGLGHHVARHLRERWFPPRVARRAGEPGRLGLAARPERPGVR